MKPEYAGLASRYNDAVDSMVDSIAEFGGISRDDAQIVFAYYKKIKALNMKHAYHGGGISVKHGAFLDAEVILRALEHAIA